MPPAVAFGVADAPLPAAVAAALAAQVNGQYKYEAALWAHGDAYERTSAAELTRIAAEGRLFVAVAAGDAVPVASATPPHRRSAATLTSGRDGFRPV